MTLWVEPSELQKREFDSRSEIDIQIPELFDFCKTSQIVVWLLWLCTFLNTIISKYYLLTIPKYNILFHFVLNTAEKYGTALSQCVCILDFALKG